MAKPHILLLPGPGQGHVIPAMELGQRLAKGGVKVTFINTEAIHKAITSNWSANDSDEEDVMQMVSIPDGLEPSDDRTNLGKVMQSIEKTMPGELEQLIERINKQDDNKVTCLIADVWMTWALPIAKKVDIARVSFFPASTTTLATMLSIPKLIDDGCINSKGIPQTSELIRLTEAMPPLKPENLLWVRAHKLSSIEAQLKSQVKHVQLAVTAERFLCNSTVELEPTACSMFPELLPIGPLVASNRLADQVGHFLQEDSTCVPWLDQQPARSVLYIAFGSITTIEQTQFEELALGLELTNRPFLWVVLPGLTKETTPAFPNGYTDRVGSRGRIVSWAPQQKVLAHPSVACFMSHCGWNSTLEGVTNGVPFLCWPYFADQFNNETYICDVWKTGLQLKEDGVSIITREEIKGKVEQILSDNTFKSNAIDIKEKVASSVKEGGSSHSNLTKFIDWINGKHTHTI